MGTGVGFIWTRLAVLVDCRRGDLPRTRHRGPDAPSPTKITIRSITVHYDCAPFMGWFWTSRRYLFPQRVSGGYLTTRTFRRCDHDLGPQKGTFSFGKDSSGGGYRLVAKVPGVRRCETSPLELVAWPSGGFPCRPIPHQSTCGPSGIDTTSYGERKNGKRSPELGGFVLKNTSLHVAGAVLVRQLRGPHLRTWP